MIEFKAAANPKIALLLDGTAEITFKTQRHIIKEFENIGDKELTVTIKDFRKKRSLSQNAYAWVLLDEIAKAINSSKIDVYKNFIKDYGVFEILPLKNEAVESFTNKWSKNGLGWFCEDLGESKLKGYTKLIVYYGSSCYNSTEIARVLEAIINECKELGINTMTLAEIALLSNDND